MSARELIAEHLNLWTGAVTKKSSSGRGSNGKVELTGIKKLRELILELAISGRLVEPERSDESAHQLLSSIKAEKSLLVAKGIIKKPKKLAALDGSEPYPVPPHWCWARLGDVTNYGTTDKAELNQVVDDTWVLELEDIEKESSRLLNKIRYRERQFKSSKNRFERGDVLYGKLRPYLDKVLVADESGVCTTEIIPIRGYLGISPEFLRLALKSPSFKHYANDSTHGMNLPRLGTDKARMAMIPLAPAQEQHRIVRKVDELMALCDRLEQQTSDQLEAHETLVETLLGTLTQSENATELADNWARLAAHFDILFTTEQSIDKLKQTILQLAVMGLLAKQTTSDEEQIESLVVKLASERVSGNATRSQSNKKNFQQAVSQDLRHPIPKNWAWVKFGEIWISSFYGPRFAKSDYVSSGGIPTVRTTDMDRRGRICLTNTPKVLVPENKKELYLLSKNDILVTRSGSIGVTAVYDLETPAIPSAYLIRLRLCPSINPHYVFIYLNSPLGQKFLGTYSTAVGVPNVSATKMGSFDFPLPPSDEQMRIVQKVDELMALCDQLKERQNKASKTRCQLAESVIEKSLI